MENLNKRKRVRNKRFHAIKQGFKNALSSAVMMENAMKTTGKVIGNVDVSKMVKSFKYQRNLR